MGADVEKIVKALRCKGGQKCEFECKYNKATYCDMLEVEDDAADLIERLSAELKKAKRECDAAVNDIYEAVDKGSCNVCDSTDCEACDGVKSHFKWRGVCVENSGGAV